MFRITFMKTAGAKALAVAAALAASVSFAEIRTLKPSEGEVVPLLSDSQKVFADMPPAERRAKFANAKFRRGLGHPRERVPGESHKRKTYWPRTVRLEWEAAPGATEYKVAVRDVRKGETVFEGTARGQSLNIDNLEVGAAYEWTVAGGGETGRGTFRTADGYPRLLRFPGVANARDIGGWTGLGGRRVRQGLVFRSCGLNDNANPEYYSAEELRALGREKEIKESAEKARKRLDQLLGWQAKPKTFDFKDPEYVDWCTRHIGEPFSDFLASRVRNARKAVSAGSKVVKGYKPGENRVAGEAGEYIRSRFGIKTDIDLRSDRECYGMKGSPLGPSVKWVHVSSSAYGGMQSAKGRQAFAKVFRTFLDEKNYPIDFHCIAGQDRTGSLAYILCALLGAEDGRLALDWELSGLRNTSVHFSHARCYDKLLAGLRKCGGANARERAEKYVLSLGFTEKDIEKFRRIMLED